MEYWSNGVLESLLHEPRIAPVVILSEAKNPV